MERILIIDDDIRVLKALHFILKNEGYKIVKASSGKEGMNVFREDHIDLIITDLIMPEKDGIEIIRELTSEFPDIKIIAISGGGIVGPMDYLYLAEALGARRTLVKPIERKELLTAVREVLLV